MFRVGDIVRLKTSNTTGKHSHQRVYNAGLNAVCTKYLHSKYKNVWRINKDYVLVSPSHTKPFNRSDWM